MKLALLILALSCVLISVRSNRIQNFDKDFRVFYDKVKEETTSNVGKIWVVLVAGSSNYFNYRHQADVCHAYQIVHRHGIPDEQIIVMMMDDIANSTENPTKGMIINHPDGKDVYHGVPKDYTGKDVTPENFLNVLMGKQISGKKVLQSGPNDHVFVNFADHGAPGLIAFPDGRLYKDDLAKAIQYMHDNKMYKQAVFYIEACESGSMFENSLGDDINVYATTAANSHESSYACYFDETRRTYLGDRYSVSWMEDTDAENIAKETLHRQFEITKRHTNQSHVTQFGNLTISKYDTVSEFEGTKNVDPSPPLRQIYDDVPSPDVKLHILKRRIIASNNRQEKELLLQEFEKEHMLRSEVSNIATALAYHASIGINAPAQEVINFQPDLLDMHCYKNAVEYFDKKCINLDEVEYGYRHIYVLGNLCDKGVSLKQIMISIDEVCK